MNNPINPIKPSKIQTGTIRGIKISELIEKLANCKNEHGDMPVMMTVEFESKAGKKQILVKPVWQGDVAIVQSASGANAKALVLKPGGEFIAPTAPLVGGE